jgi:hypothetical protein
MKDKAYSCPTTLERLLKIFVKWKKYIIRNPKLVIGGGGGRLNIFKINKYIIFKKEVKMEWNSNYHNYYFLILENFISAMLPTTIIISSLMH